ncbi:MAG: hypothetical protein P8P30_09405 [Rickettsiales bacterium]|nr:hypothetical protein [Rickettsiales bacterium]
MNDKSLFITALLLLTGVLLVAPAAAQQAQSAQPEAQEVKYNCPYLHDETRRTLAKLTQGNEGWFFRQSDINEYFALLPHAKGYLKRLTEAFANQGTKLILLQVPPRPFASYRYFNRGQPGQRSFRLADGMPYYENYLKELKTTGATVIDLLDVMNKVDPKTGLHFFYKRDMHWTPFGASAAARRIATALKADTTYQKITPTVYTTEATGELRMKGSIAMEVETLCAEVVPAEPYPSYQTNAQLSKGQDALFGDVSSASPIVLLGSSFSAVSWFNFDGFLSEHTGLEVANFAISAGKLFNALVSYTALPKEERLNPDFVVWENLAHYDFNLGDTMFRQAIPAVYGECSAAEAIQTAKVNLVGDNTDAKALFSLPAGQKISGTDYYLFLKSSNKGLSNFTLEMEYDDGDGEWFVLDRRQNFTNAGRFFVELSEEITSSLKSVRLVGLPSIKSELEVRLCRISNKG